MSADRSLSFPSSSPPTPPTSKLHETHRLPWAESFSCRKDSIRPHRSLHAQHSLPCNYRLIIAAIGSILSQPNSKVNPNKGKAYLRPLPCALAQPREHCRRCLDSCASSLVAESKSKEKTHAPGFSSTGHYSVESRQPLARPTVHVGGLDPWTAPSPGPEYIWYHACRVRQAKGSPASTTTS